MTVAAELHVIIVAPEGVTGSLRVLIERLAGLGIGTQTVEDVSAAAALAGHAPANPPALLVDLRELTSGDPDEQRLATEAIKRALFVLPQCTPIAVTHEAPTTLMLACVRAGAADLIDLGLEGTAAVRQVVTRVWLRQRERLADAESTAALRGIVEDLLKDLIKTERRSLALEDRRDDKNGARPPAIVIVEPDRPLAEELAHRLEAAGLTTYAFVRGEDAAAATEAFDLAIIAAQLPGIDGIATLAQLRERIPGLPAFLLTAGRDGALAAQAADLGVVGFIDKPVSDLAGTVGRIGALAADAAGRAREHSYLERIKDRHEHVLARYRALPRDR